MIATSPIAAAQPWITGGLVLVCLAMIALFVVGTIEVKNGYVRITPEEISYRDWRRKTITLRWGEVAGYRTLDNLTLLVPRSVELPRIKITYMTERYADIQALLAEHLPDLNTTEAQAEEAQLLSRADLGDTEATRESKLRAARRAAQAVNWVGGLTAVWLFAYPHPYEYACGAGLLVPVLAVCVLFIYQPLVRIDDVKNSTVPSIAIGLLLPVLGLAIRGVFDIELLDYAPFWPLMIQTTFLTAVALALGSQRTLRQAAHRATEWLAIGMIAVAYGYGAPYIINATFDQAIPTEYRASMLSKYSSGGKTTTYYLNVGPWGPRRAADNVTVSHDYYRRVQPGDSVTMLVSPGRLGVPWFTVAE